MKKAEYIRPEIMTVDVLTESSYALTATGIGGEHTVYSPFFIRLPYILTAPLKNSQVFIWLFDRKDLYLCHHNNES